MKKTVKFTGVLIVILILTAGPVFSQQATTLEDLRGGVETFSQAMAGSLPFNASIGLNWSDAYIGQLLSFPPHLGIGLTYGATTMDVTALNGMLDLLGADEFEVDGGLAKLIPAEIPGTPLPGYAAEARIGGLFFPFDIGVKYFGSIIPAFNDVNSILGNFGLSLDMDYEMFGVDFRYPLINPKSFPFKLSIGLGYTNLKGGINTSIASPLNELRFGEGDEFFITLDDPDFRLEWSSNVFEFKMQMSMPLFIITPYLGAGINYSRTKAGYRIASGYNVDTNDPDTLAGLDELGVSTTNGVSQIISNDNWNVRAFGGVSLNLFILKFDITAMYNLNLKSINSEDLMKGQFGITAGFRIQL